MDSSISELTMASLGWLLNLNFGGSASAAAAAGPIAGSMLLMGVGRSWWLVPFFWQLLTGRAYSGELDGMVEYFELGAFFFSGFLAALGCFRLVAWWQDYQKKKHEPPKFAVDDTRKLTRVGALEGPGRVCPYCHCEGVLYVLSDQSVVCPKCYVA